MKTMKNNIFKTILALTLLIHFFAFQAALARSTSSQREYTIIAGLQLLKHPERPYRSRGDELHNRQTQTKMRK